MEFTEEYEDILFNIETCIVAVYRNFTDVSDYTAINALEAIVGYLTFVSKFIPQ